MSSEQSSSTLDDSEVLLQVQGNALDGFPESWSTARIVAKDVGFVTVVYDDVSTSR